MTPCDVASPKSAESDTKRHEDKLTVTSQSGLKLPWDRKPHTWLRQNPIHQHCPQSLLHQQGSTDLPTDPVIITGNQEAIFSGLISLIYST